MSNIKDFVIEDGVLREYTGNGGDIVIPDEVTEIYAWAFSECENLTGITIPDSVTSIGAWAFSECESLTHITLPHKITVIKEYTFSYCTSLTRIIIPDGVTKIEEGAFSNCENLTDITISNSVTNIEPEAFSNCLNLTDITLPDGITSIDRGTFAGCCSLKSISIPDKVTTICNSVFWGCENLTDITIHDNVTSIGKSAFIGCKSLTDITIPDSVTHIGAGAFTGCKGLKDENGFVIIRDVLYGYFGIGGNVVIPQNVTQIVGHAFERCHNITSITIPASVTSIEENAFFGCNKPTEIILSETDNITYNIDSLNKLWKYFSKTEHAVVFKYSVLKHFFNLVLENNSLNRKIKAIKNQILELAINNDDATVVGNLFSLYKTLSLDAIDEYIEKAASAPSVRVFLLEYKNRNYSAEKQEKHKNDKLDKELGFKERTLADWKKLYSFTTENDTITITSYKGTELDIVVPEKISKYKVVSISEKAFSPLAENIKPEQIEIRKNLKNMIIPDGITNIGAEAFNGCESLESVILPQNITYINTSTFSDCINLRSITIPDGVLDIGWYAFYNCRSLKSVTIPASVTHIFDYVFLNSENVTIHTPAGSYAEKYAKERKIPFVVE